MSTRSKIRIGRLNYVGGVVDEMARVYREMRRDQLDKQDGERLIRSLTAIRQGLEATDIERRLNELEESALGDWRPK